MPGIISTCGKPGTAKTCRHTRKEKCFRPCTFKTQLRANPGPEAASPSFRIFVPVFL
jgi:hypothetical protein